MPIAYRARALMGKSCALNSFMGENAIAWASAISYRASQILVAHGSPSHALDEILPLCELSYWKGYVARKESREQLLNLRLRMQKSAMNVDDSRCLINRLLSALSELLSMKSIRGILHNCETLDMATAHSLKCCEELVAAGAITILLKLIRAASRSIPDQQVLKHALSTLRNLARYPHLTQLLIDTPASVETILWELHRNKEEGYFIASQILKKICSNENGVITVHKFPALLKRLYNLVEELTRKAYNEKRLGFGY
ncbi:hypothetical protein GOBAR_DD30706 [Gossypium barbadense]|nr:hypothetical protein GOBAR_DD30706 [Gossypium barbadense]